MKYLSFITIALLFLGTSCSSKQSKAENLVKTFVEKKLGDPKSYESVSFSNLEPLRDTTRIFDGKPEKVRHYGQYEIEHTYRSKNAFGGVVTASKIYHIDSSFTTVIGDGFVGQRVQKTIN